MNALRGIFGGAKSSTAQRTSSGAPAAEITKNRSVLLIDDDQSVLDSLSRVIHMLRRDWNVMTATSGEDGLQYVVQQAYDAVVCDMSMPGLHGLRVLAQIKAHAPSTTLIALTGFTDEQWKLRNQTVAHVFLTKPCAPNDLINAIERPEAGLWPLDVAHHPLRGQRTTAPRPARRTKWNDDDDEEVTFS